MKLSSLFDSFVKRTRTIFWVLGKRIKIRDSRDFWTKYHELYLKGDFNLMNKKHFLEEWFCDSVGYFPDIDNPKTLNEKIQWYKLYYNDPLIARCIDKVSFKDYIKEVLGSEYVIPTLGIYLSANEINFENLPNQFVIKANYGSSAKEIIIVKDKSKLDIEGTRTIVSSWEKPWWRGAWGGYEIVQPKILIEEYIEQVDGQVYDYKFMCFNGDPKYIIVHTDRFNKRTIDIFNVNWENLDVMYNDRPNSKRKIEQPKHLSKMIEISKQVSKRFPLVRVDFYDIGDWFYIGELTFYPDGGMSRYHSKKWDYEFGEMLNLPEKLN